MIFSKYTSLAVQYRGLTGEVGKIRSLDGVQLCKVLYEEGHVAKDIDSNCFFGF